MGSIKQFLLAAALVLVAASSGWAATATRTNAFEYDAVTGLVLKEIVEPDDAQLRVDTVYTRDGFGNKLTATVSSPATGSAAIATRTSSMTYDTQGRFTLTATNALSQSETRTYDARFGTMTSLTGPNALTTQWQYDGFGRQIMETRADGNRTQTIYSYCPWIPGGTTLYYCPGLGAFNILNVPLPSTGTTRNGPAITNYMDRLGREIQRDTDAVVEGTESWALLQLYTNYDTLGRVAQQTRPVRNGLQVAPDLRWTVFEYDVLGRVIKQTAPDNSITTTAYNGLTATITNPLLQTHSETKNSQGKIVSTKDNLNGVTAYVYDPFGNLVQTTDPAGNISSMQYDIRGRKIGMTDPDMGHWTYSYDVLGQLVSQTDAKLQTVTFTYDKLGRMLTRVEPDLTSTWVYDATTMGIGKLATATASNGYARSHSYDSVGRPSSTSLTVDGNTHSIAQTYNSDGRLSTLTYPSGFAVKYLYTWLGYFDEVRNNGTNATVWKAEKRDATLNYTQSRMGNSLVTSRTYDPNTGRMTAVQVGPGFAVQNEGYNWDTAGNLLTRTDAVQGINEAFTYDGLNQVATAAVSGGPSKTFAYNSIGNITSKSDAGTYTYPSAGAARPHAVSSIAGAVNATYSYDGNGNLISGAGRTIAWTSFNMPATIQRGTNVLAYQYDTEHNRIKQADASIATLFFNDPASGLTVEKVLGSGGSLTWNNYVYVNGQIVAVFYERPSATSQWRYFHHDQLGSIAVITDETGAVVERLSYDSWGKRRFPTGADDPTESIVSSTDRSYTGHAYLQEVGLIHMNGRVYDPVLARFVSADPNVQSPTRTQSFNRYSYVMNNPLNATDPTGFEVPGAFNGSIYTSPAGFTYWTNDLPGLSMDTRYLFNPNPATTPFAITVTFKPTSSGLMGDSIKGWTAEFAGSIYRYRGGSDRGFWLNQTESTRSFRKAIGSFANDLIDGPARDIPKFANDFLRNPDDTVVRFLNTFPVTSFEGKMAGAAITIFGAGSKLEKAGVSFGHLEKTHVGLSDTQLVTRLTDKNLKLASTFTNAVEAENAFAKALQVNAGKIQAWNESASAGSRLAIHAPFEGGRVMAAGATTAVPGSSVTFILQRSGLAPGTGYHVVTGFVSP